MTSESDPPPAREELTSYPDFDLACLSEQDEQHGAITIYDPAGERVVSRWITADYASTTPIEATR